MKIQKLSISNFKSIKQLEIELPNICALVGPNNAGKTNILEAMRRVLLPDWGPRATHFSEDDVYFRDPERDIEISVTFGLPIDYAKLQKAQPVQISTLCFSYNRYKKGENKGARKLDQSCLGLDGGKLMVQTAYPRPGKQPKFEPIVGIPQEVRDRVPFIHIGTNRALKEQLPSGRFSLLRQIFEDIDRDLHDPENKVVVEKDDGTKVEVPRIQRFKELMVDAMALLKTGEFKDIEAAIKKHALEQLGLDAESDDIDLFFTPINTMDFYKSLDLIVREGNFALSATQMGDGMQNAIVLAILRAFEETRRQGAIILIEEPEMFLHPQMQRSLYSTLRRIGQTNQVIYSTHSPHFVSIPEYKDVLLVRRDEGRASYVSRSDLDENSWRRERLRQAMDRERSELFFSRRLLIVEGDTEKLSFPEFATKIDLDLDREGATIVEVGGKRNLYEFAELAMSFEIPTGVVYDRDSSDFRNSRDDEAELNAKLDSLAKPDGTVKVWRLEKDYEDHVKRAVGETKYQELCQRYPTATYGRKGRRQRMIAADTEVSVPTPFDKILKWLAGQDAEPDQDQVPGEPGLNDDIPF